MSLTKKELLDQIDRPKQARFTHQQEENGSEPGRISGSLQQSSTEMVVERGGTLSQTRIIWRVAAQW
jgi:hypothetical protein